MNSAESQPNPLRHPNGRFRQGSSSFDAAASIAATAASKGICLLHYVRARERHGVRLRRFITRSRSPRVTHSCRPPERDEFGQGRLRGLPSKINGWHQSRVERDEFGQGRLRGCNQNKWVAPISGAGGTNLGCQSCDASSQSSDWGWHFGWQVACVYSGDFVATGSILTPSTPSVPTS